MKEVVKPQKDVGKEERCKTCIHLKQKWMCIIFITGQDFSVNYKINFVNMETVIGQFNDWPTVTLHIPLQKVNPFLRKHLLASVL